MMTQAVGFFRGAESVEDKARDLRSRKVRQLGNLVISP